MQVFLIVFTIYLIFVLLCHIIAYISWVIAKTSNGNTFGDLIDYIDDDSFVSYAAVWIPAINILILFILLIGLIIGKLKDLRIR